MVDRTTQNPSADWQSQWGARRSSAAVWLLVVIAAILIGWALHATAWVTMPLAFAFFIALAVWPVDAWVQHRVPDRLGWLGHLAAMALILVALALFFAGIWFAAQQVASRLPQYADEFQAWWNRIAGPGAGGGSGSAGAAAARQTQAGQPAQETLLSEAAGALTGTDARGGNILDFVTNYATTIINSAWSTLAMMVLVFFLVLLMLIEAPVWRAKVANATPDRQEASWFDSVAAVAQRFRWYLLVRTILGAITGILYALWLWIWGVDFVIVWGLLAFLLNYVPTLGSLIAGLLPIVFAFLTKDVGSAVAVGIGILVIEQIMGNYVDPRIQGKQLSISPLVVLVVLLFWGWVWGIAGALLAVPMTVLIIIVFAHVPALKPVALFLSNERDLRGLEESASADT